MIKELNGWKVLSGYKDGIRYSCSVNTFHISYPVNKRVYPSLRYSMLLFLKKEKTQNIL